MNGFTLDEQLILISGYFLDVIHYDKKTIIIDDLNNLVKKGYLELINNERYFLTFRCTKKGKEEGRIITENIESKYLKETDDYIKTIQKRIDETRDLFIKSKKMNMPEIHKDVQELMESGIDIDSLKNMSTYLVDDNKKRWKYKKSYNNPVGVEVLILEEF